MLLNVTICVHYPDPFHVILQYIQYSRFRQKFVLAIHFSSLSALYCSLTYDEVALLGSNLVMQVLLPPCAFIQPIEESFLLFVFF